MQKSNGTRDCTELPFNQSRISIINQHTWDEASLECTCSTNGKDHNALNNEHVKNHHVSISEDEKGADLKVN